LGLGNTGLAFRHGLDPGEQIRSFSHKRAAGGKGSALSELALCVEEDILAFPSTSEKDALMPPDSFEIGGALEALIFARSMDLGHMGTASLASILELSPGVPKSTKDSVLQDSCSGEIVLVVSTSKSGATWIFFASSAARSGNERDKAERGWESDLVIPTHSEAGDRHPNVGDDRTPDNASAIDDEWKAS